MKKIAYIVAILGATNLSYAQHQLTVEVTNLKNNKGVVEIGLFNSKEGFLKEGSQIKKEKVKISDNTVSHTFKDLPKGNYAVAVFHDENQNNICDRNLIGIPIEKYGFSNNFRPKLSAPSFHQVQFLLNKNHKITIKLI